MIEETDIIREYQMNLKSDSQLPKKRSVTCFIENYLKIMKNPFYFILKAPFVIKILSFCDDFLVT